MKKINIISFQNGFVFHVRGSGWVQNVVPSTYGKSAQFWQYHSDSRSQIIS